VRAERMGWLPSAPQLKTNPLDIAKKAAQAAGVEPKDYVAQRAEVRRARDVLRGSGSSGQLAAQHVRLALEPARLVRQGARVFPEAPARHSHGVQGKDLGEPGAQEAEGGRSLARRGAGRKARSPGHARFPHVDDCVYSDIVLPTATWYEKNDLNTSDMHPFIHPLTAAVDPAWEAQRLGNLQGIAKKFSEVAPEVLGVEKDVVLTPIQHDTAGEWRRPSTSRTGRKASVEPIPGKTMPRSRSSSATIRTSTRSSPRSVR
jgi:nitrate reductase alpha subunit